MNDTVLKELKTVVEQAVQPVRATLARKRKIREELLAYSFARLGPVDKQVRSLSGLETQGTHLAGSALRISSAVRFVASLHWGSGPVHPDGSSGRQAIALPDRLG